MEKDKFREKAYEILYNKYKGIVNHLITNSINHQNIDRDSGKILKENRQEFLEAKAKHFENIGLLEQWSYYGILSKEDIAVVKALEYCLGEREIEAK